MPTAARPARAQTPDLTGVFLVTGAALLWSSGGLIVRLLQGVDSWTIVFWRSLAAFAFLTLFGMVSEGADYVRAFGRMRLPAFGITLCYVVASISLIVALKLTTVADVLILMSCAPLLAALLGRIILGEQLGTLGWIALAGSIAGAGIMVSDSYAHGSITGDLVALCIALAQAVAIILFRQHRTISMVPGVTLAMLVAAALVSPFASFAPVAPRDAGLIGFFGAGQLGLGLAMFASGARLIPAAQTAMFGVLEPVIGPFWVWLALGERPSPAGLLGGAIVIAALVLFTLSAMRKSGAAA
jgi:drug/metabolite transporter (DMT)-like permease